MDTALVALIGAAATVGGSLITYAGTRRKYTAEIERLKHERLDERERQFEKAQIGYRKLYEKLINHYWDAKGSGTGLDDLHDDHVEAQMVGFKPVCTALDAFWPEQQRLARELPNEDKLEPLLEAMRMHGSMRLSQFDEMRQRGQT